MTTCFSTEKAGGCFNRSSARFALRALVALAVVLGLCLVVLAVNLVATLQSEMVSRAAQDDTAYIDRTETNEPHLTSATTQVIRLTSLMGLTSDAAIARVGHGAAPQQQDDSLGSLDFSNEVVLLLTNEAADALSGTPTVRLGISDAGVVNGASYSAPLSVLGYGELSFADAVEEFYLVERMLQKVGLQVAIGSVVLPDASAYSSYDWDGTTLSSQRYTFSGQAQSGETLFSWELTLDYDYTQANATSDLANTTKRLTVAIRPI